MCFGPFPRTLAVNSVSDFFFLMMLFLTYGVFWSSFRTSAVNYVSDLNFFIITILCVPADMQAKKTTMEAQDKKRRYITKIQDKRGKIHMLWRLDMIRRERYMINTQNKKGKTHSGTVHWHKTRKVKHDEEMHATRIKKEKKKKETN